MSTQSTQAILRPGEFLFTQTAVRISTLLGSCVAVTLFCPRTRHAAICHALLPTPTLRASVDNPGADPGRYLTEIIPLLLSMFRDKGCKPAELQAKVFGGSSITLPAPGNEKHAEVGPENVMQAFALLASAGIRVRASNTGGRTGHQIIFDTGTGDVMHRSLIRSETPHIPPTGHA